MAKVCDRSDNITDVAVVENDLYLLANTDAIRGRVVKTAARAPNLKAAKTVLPMGAIVVEALTAARDGVYITTMDGGIEQLKRIGRDDRVADVALPYDGQIVYTYGDAASDGILINITGWVEPSAVWAVDPVTLKASDTKITPPPPIELSPYVATRFFATAKDGVKIPLSIVARRDTPKDGKRPAIVFCPTARISMAPRRHSRRATSLSSTSAGFASSPASAAAANMAANGTTAASWRPSRTRGAT